MSLKNRFKSRFASDAEIAYLRAQILAYNFEQSKKWCCKNAPCGATVHGKYKCDYVTIRKYGDLEKMVYHSTPVKNGGEQPDKYVAKNSKNTAKLDNNFARARSKIFEYAMCNNFTHFATFTLDSAKYDRYNLDGFRSDLAQFIRNYNKKYNLSIKYIMIPEPHKDGAWHMHGLFLGLPDEHLNDFVAPSPVDLIDSDYKNWLVYQRKFGFCSFAPIKNRTACAKYITKYVQKTINCKGGLKNALGKHLYYASHGLNNSALLYDGRISHADDVAWEFENDYVKIIWSDNPEYQKIIFID